MVAEICLNRPQQNIFKPRISVFPSSVQYIRDISYRIFSFTLISFYTKSKLFFMNKKIKESGDFDKY